MACPGCGRRAEPVCPSCAGRLAAPPPAPPPFGVDAWAAAFAYDGVARELVARVKYRGAHAAVSWLAARMADAAARAALVDRVDAVTWAPTTATRRRTRGFDHAELLAHRCRARSAFPHGRCCTGCRVRRRPGSTPRTAGADRPSRHAARCPRPSCWSTTSRPRARHSPRRPVPSATAVRRAWWRSPRRARRGPASVHLRVPTAHVPSTPPGTTRRLVGERHTRRRR